MAHQPRRAALVGLVSFTLLVAACGGGDGGDGGGDADATVRPAQEQIVVASTDAETPFELQSGRYKVGWQAPDCTAVTFVLTGQGQGFTWEKSTRLQQFSSIVSEVPEDVYTIAQTDPGCAAWTVQIDRVGS